MKKRTIIQRAHDVTALITLTALIFYLLFQINKGGPFRAINPFAKDPYDVVGSFAVQGALFVGLLTYARALSLCGDPAQAAKMRLIPRGNLLVLSAILVTLFTDGIAVAIHSISRSFWGTILLVELVSMTTLTLVCGLAFFTVFWQMPTATPPSDLTPADAIDDLWTLVRVPVTIVVKDQSGAVFKGVMGFNSDWLFSHASWFDPRMHPWRFAYILGVFFGVSLSLAQMQEGVPPGLLTGLFLVGIFITAEVTFTLAGFAIFGGYLGLRPSNSRG